MHKRTLLTTLSIVALAVAVAATTAASATRKSMVSSVRLCTGISLFHGWHCSVPRTPRAGAYSPGARRDAVLFAAGAYEIGWKGVGGRRRPER